jgi:uncharacterized membrane protein YvbJ
MVYCSKCGTQNDDSNRICSNCGSPLYTVGEKYSGSEREHYRRVERECFGIPNGTMIVTIIIGAIVILWGLSVLLDTYNLHIEVWPIILVVIGLLLIVGALYRRRRYSTSV